jgi:hypothetical protein
VTPAGWDLADGIADAARRVRELRDDIDMMERERATLVDDQGRPFPLHPEYRAFLREYRGTVADCVAQLPSWEDRWVGVAEIIQAPGRWDAGIAALVNDQRMTPFFIRSYGFTEDDLMTLGQFDYRSACRIGVDIGTVATWIKPMDAFMESGYFGALECEIVACDSELRRLGWQAYPLGADYGWVA